MEDSSTLSTICWIANPFCPVADTQCVHCGRQAEVLAVENYAVNFVQCRSECGAKYCGDDCRQASLEAGHLALCVGPHTQDHAIYKLKVLALEAGPTNYATIQLASTLVCSLGMTRVMQLPGIKLEASSVKHRVLSQSLEGLVSSSYALVVEIIDAAVDKKPVLSVQEWTNLLQYVSLRTVEGSTKSKYASECERITGAGKWDDECNRYLLFDVLDQDEATAIEIMDEPAQHFTPTEWFALFEENIRHSCLPSHEIFGETLGEMCCRRIEGGDNPESGQEPTISIIDNLHELEIRSEMLEEKGLVKCQCLRCCFERDPLTDILLSSHDLNLLLEHAKVQMRYDDAMDVAEAIVKLNPRDGAALLNQARIAGWLGDFQKREQLLKEAAILVDDQAINTALKETRAYYRKKEGDRSDNSSIVWETAKGLEECVYVGENVLDAEECRQMVNLTEQYQKERGSWTTSRHYAVPTTDVPVYQIPELLAWFNVQLEQRIFPAMEAHFDTEGRLRVFDAFLVKYDADAGQKRLPLHNDQSEFSLTIAMNPMACYEGGGTYFNDVDETTKTDVGGIISFKGELLHAGQMITKGQRYVIVCFIYEEDLQ